MHTAGNLLSINNLRRIRALGAYLPLFNLTPKKLFFFGKT